LNEIFRLTRTACRVVGKQHRLAVRLYPAIHLYAKIIHVTKKCIIRI
jgi:hypothetical protein